MVDMVAIKPTATNGATAFLKYKYLANVLGGVSTLGATPFGFMIAI